MNMSYSSIETLKESDMAAADAAQEVSDGPKLDRFGKGFQPESEDASVVHWQDAFRHSIARELHDDLGQKLALLTIQFEQLRRDLLPAPPRIAERFRQLKTTSDALAGSLQELCHNLHPAALSHLGLAEALRELVGEFGLRHSLSVCFCPGRLPEDIQPDVAVSLYRIAQEALHNIAQHAGETPVRVTLTFRRKRFILSIRDFGRGFDPKRAEFAAGLGRNTMRERAELVGGFFQLHSRRGAGTLIRVIVPERGRVVPANPNIGEGNRLYRMLVRDIGNPAIFLVDLEGVILSWNAGVQNILGYAEAEFVGQNLAFLSPGEENNGRIAEREAEAAARDSSASHFRRHRRRDGSYVDTSCIFRIVRDELGCRAGLAVFLQDATAQKHSDEQRAHITEVLQQSNNDLSRFSQVLSHDLRAPLRMVESYVQLLRSELDGRLDGASRECMSYVVQGIDHMDRLITSLLKYAQANDPQLASVQVSLERILRETLDILSIELRGDAASVTHDPLPSVLGDPVLLLELFQNLIANALKYRTGQAPQIHFSAQEQDTEWTISVRDNGIGIDPQYAEKIFLPLTRLHDRRSPAVESGSPFASESWNAMAAASGWNRKPGMVPPFFSRFRNS